MIELITHTVIRTFINTITITIRKITIMVIMKLGMRTRILETMMDMRRRVRAIMMVMIRNIRVIMRLDMR